jgi:ABC-type uncharacterized transport system YnjBCD ATPase subunit
VGRTGHVVTTAPVQGSPHRLLGRLNRRGFRLLHVADASLLAAITVGTMLVRFGLRWPNYEVWQYLISFALTVAIFMLALYFGGLYEREPRLGSPAALPRIADFGIKTSGPDASIGTLSGGNVQRVVLARELSRGCRVLIVMNPVFGLDFAAVDEIHRRLLEARNGGAAVLLVSEDLDELIELSDRVVVMSGGALVYETASPVADRGEIGRRMGGSGHEHVPTVAAGAASPALEGSLA